MNRIHAGLLVLEPQVAAHAAEMFEVLSDPALYEFERAPPESVAWLEQRFARLESRGSSDGQESWLNWVIRLPTGELAGYVQATVTPDHTAIIAYEISSRFWRRGIGSTAVRAMLDELAQTYGARTFIATLKRRNHRSRGLLQRLGFENAGPRSDDEDVMRRAASPETRDR